jgi:hypothetical protein
MLLLGHLRAVRADRPGGSQRLSLPLFNLMSAFDPKRTWRPRRGHRATQAGNTERILLRSKRVRITATRGASFLVSN